MTLADIFDQTPHPCEHPGCPHTVPYDDEPYCFDHTPDDSSGYQPGYSYKRNHRR